MYITSIQQKKKEEEEKRSPGFEKYYMSDHVQGLDGKECVVEALPSLLFF